MLKQFIVITIIGVLLATIAAPSISAKTDPLKSSNNKHGIHIIDENDLEEAAKLVNSNGGEWGYVTLVIQQTDRDIDKWQRTFDKMRKLKLIPVIRIATYAKGSVWAKPSVNEAVAWRDFFQELNWVVENRYIILFNEPNHAQEWEGTIEPKEYAEITKVFTDTLRTSNEDYYILPAGMDLAASTTKSTMSATDYYEAIYQSDPEYFTRFDGWTSHSYPNPNFSGSVHDTGRISIRGFDWERSYLEQYGLNQSIAIFITETGWAHSEGRDSNPGFYSASEVAHLYETAYDTAWNDQAIVMVSPFLLNYQDAPFDHFSWKQFNSDTYYPQHQSVVSLEKIQGDPRQRDGALLTNGKTPLELTTNALVFVPVTVKNVGQKIWEDGSVRVQISINDEPVTQVSLGALEPEQTSTLKVPLKTTNQKNQVTIKSEVLVNEDTVGASDIHEITVIDKQNSIASLVPIIKTIAQNVLLERYSEQFGFFSFIE